MKYIFQKSEVYPWFQNKEISLFWNIYLILKGLNLLKQFAVKVIFNSVDKSKSTVIFYSFWVPWVFLFFDYLISASHGIEPTQDWRAVVFGDGFIPIKSGKERMQEKKISFMHTKNIKHGSIPFWVYSTPTIKYIFCWT